MIMPFQNNHLKSWSFISTFLHMAIFPVFKYILWFFLTRLYYEMNGFVYFEVNCCFKSYFLSDFLNGLFRVIILFHTVCPEFSV